MAGRYVILEFHDKDAAEGFVTHPDLNQEWGYSVKAMFMKPDKFCECPDKQRHNVQNWAKGKRTGLYLCKRCRKPSTHHQTGIMSRLQYVFGYNQLEGGDEG